MGLDTIFEKKYFKEGYTMIVGIDEVGRGCWAGPMYFCAYIFEIGDEKRRNVDDSKKISRKKREEIYQELDSNNYEIEIFDNDYIDKHTLGRAALEGLERLLTKISTKFPERKIKFLVDGYFKGDWEKRFDVVFLRQGDQKVYSIAAASIMAKVERDRYMIEISKKYDCYDFENNVGYGTKKHRRGLMHNGICTIHRKSYKPIRKIIEKEA